ncbi:MAG: repair protein SbcD/Mre11 [Actinomycetota bacterium]|nr:repair protein SbcD/Mre11 [Actinomycetota bacterium]
MGKKLGRIDRIAETEAVLNELVAIAEENQADLIAVTGDLFDRISPPFASLGLVLDTLVRLADTGAPVVVIPGNHDSAQLFGVLESHLGKSNVTIVPKPRRPDEGGVLRFPARDGKTTAQVACFPFLHESDVVDFVEPTEDWFKSYAERVRKICGHYSAWMAGHADRSSVEVLLGHFMVDGAVPSGSERPLHIGEAYMATPQAIPAQINYAGLGHIHLCQEAPGAAVPAWYCGSLLQLDFGEADQDKFVLIVEVGRHRPGAQVEKIPLKAGRKLLKVQGTLEGLRARAGDFGDAILHVEVLTDGPSPGLADEVREFLPDALYVRADYERETVDISSREGRSLPDLYAEFYAQKHGAQPAPELMGALGELLEEVPIEL